MSLGCAVSLGMECLARRALRQAQGKLPGRTGETGGKTEDGGQTTEGKFRISDLKARRQESEAR
jgi:hypothetical protein